MNVETLRQKYSKVKAGFLEVFGRDVLPTDFDTFMSLITGQAKVNILTNRVMCSLADDIVNASEVAPPMAFMGRDLGVTMRGAMYGIGFCMEYITYTFSQGTDIDDSVIEKLRLANHVFSYKEYALLLGLRTLIVSVYTNIENSLLNTPAGITQMNNMCNELQVEYRDLLAHGDDLSVAAKSLEQQKFGDDSLIMATLALIQRYGHNALLCYLGPKATEYLAKNKLNTVFTSMNTAMDQENVSEDKSDGKFSFKEF